MNRISSIYRAVSLIALNTFILFSLVNLVALVLPIPQGDRLNYQGEILSAKEVLTTNADLREKLYPGFSLQQVIEMHQTPGILPHPTLEFMERPINNRYYHVGFENMRYHAFVHPNNAQTKINGSVWVFGGSTAFGHGVTNDQTIAFYLDSLDPVKTYINFGVQGFHQDLEIQKLIGLLRKGYRPREVLFIDGLNDLAALTSTFFNESETPAKPFDAYGSYNPDNNLSLLKKYMVSLPVVKRYYEYKASNESAKQFLTSDPYNMEGLYHSNPLYHYYLSRYSSYQPSPLLAKKILSYYSSNIKLLQALATEYGFTYSIIFQPMGIFCKTNPFVKDRDYFEQHFPDYANHVFMAQTVRVAIREGNLSHFRDLSELDTAFRFPYVDLTHYSPSFNKAIAEHILMNKNK